MRVAGTKEKAVLFTYDIHPRYGEKVIAVKLQGLDPNRRYLVNEINLMPGVTSSLKENGKTYTGDYLMKVGIDALTTRDMSSRVIELTAQ